MKHSIKVIIVAAIMLIAFAITGTDDYKAAKAEQERYCSMVALEIWPDFNRNYDKICK